MPTFNFQKDFSNQQSVARQKLNEKIEAAVSKNRFLNALFQD